MRLHGEAFLALWNGVTAAQLDAYEDWHSREHVPERLTVPGILGAWRYRATDGGEPGFFTLYDLAGIDVLDTPAYRRLLMQPTPASTLMRPHLTHFSRIVCRLDRRDRTPDGRFIAPLILRNAGADLAPVGGIAWQRGAIDPEAPGHPMAGARAEPGAILLVEGDDKGRVKQAGQALGVEAPRCFQLIEAFAAAA
jgi:hypothetical protein